MEDDPCSSLSLSTQVPRVTPRPRLISERAALFLLILGVSLLCMTPSLPTPELWNICDLRLTHQRLEVCSSVVPHLLSM